MDSRRTICRRDKNGMSKSTVSVDFTVKAIPEVYKDDTVYARFVTTDSGVEGKGQSLHIALHNNGFVSMIEIFLDEFKGKWVESAREGTEAAFEKAHEELVTGGNVGVSE